MRAPGSAPRWVPAPAFPDREARPRSRPERQLSRRLLLFVPHHTLQWRSKRVTIRSRISAMRHARRAAGRDRSHDGDEMFPIPKSVFLTRGVGVHRQRLSAFEYALRDADIEQQNLVTVSSILPANCELISRKAGIAMLSP